ncbi:alanine/glycine:cation symporter family protein [Peptoniphilus grossensis]|uniref:alanine/glycine:cation symporter family protein n=1 Tax=Peptoniphilus grossensis TaxID=1465756 RepID=UPI0039948898
MESVILKLIKQANGFLWGPAALIFLGVIGIYLTIGTKGVHIRKFKLILSETIGSISKRGENDGDGVLSSAQSMFTSLASVIGMGSIVGVASALIYGGPGAIIWMWIAAFIGMIIKYSEIIIIIKYRRKAEDGTYVGGPGLYVKNGLNIPFIGEILVLLMIIVCLLSTAIQSNVIIENVINMIPVAKNYKIIVTVLNMIIAGVVVVGGIKRIGEVAEKLVPFMSVFYLIASIIVIASNYNNIIPVIILMFKGSVSKVAITGGALGYGIMKAMQYGIARGFFVSGAGQAVFTVSHAPAKVNNPVEQAIYGVTEIFLVTIICTATGLAVLTSGIFSPDGNSSIMVTQAFAQTSKIFGYAVSIATILFAYTTVIGFGYIGESQLSTIISSNNAKFFKIFYLIAALIGGITVLDSIWDVTDFFLAIIMVINLIVILLKSKEIFDISNDYWKNYDK